MSLEEFYKEAPPEISRPAITLTEPHQQTLARLDWELEQRKRWVCDVPIPWADTCSSGCPQSIFQLQESGQTPRAAGRSDVGMKVFTPSWISVEQAFIVWLGDSLCAELGLLGSLFHRSGNSLSLPDDPRSKGSPSWQELLPFHAMVWSWDSPVSCCWRHRCPRGQFAPWEKQTWHSIPVFG